MFFYLLGDAMKVAYIMRGVPGSGKTTVAKMLANGTGAVCSTDDFFFVDGEYRFDPDQLQKNHDRNFEKFCRSLHEGAPIVICDNTNVKRWHFERYVHAAKQSGYLVVFVVMSHPRPEVAAKRSIHRVPALTIQLMIEGWED